MNTNKTFSVIVPVYNGEKYIQDTFDSLKSQSFKDFEVIVVDGLSTDRTMQIVNANLDIVSVVISEKDKGMYDAVNKGMKRANGRFLCYLNSDDRLVSDALYQVNRVFTEKNCDLVVGNVNFISSAGEIIYGSKAFNVPRFVVSYTRRVPFAQQSSFWTREIYEKIGGFDDELKYVADSKFFFSILFDDTANMVKVDRVLGEFRLHDDSFSIGSSEKMRQESLMMRQQFPELRFNEPLRLFFEFFLKMLDLKNLIRKKRHNGIKL